MIDDIKKDASARMGKSVEALVEAWPRSAPAALTRAFSIT
jgi:hypothetical protein